MNLIITQYDIDLIKYILNKQSIRIKNALFFTSGHKKFAGLLFVFTKDCKHM